MYLNYFSDTTYCYIWKTAENSYFNFMNMCAFVFISLSLECYMSQNCFGRYEKAKQFHFFV